MKTIVIGLDGGTWKYIEPMAAEGMLPNFKKLMEEGSYGALHSTFPPVTSPAWFCMTTGFKPEHIDLYSFFKFEGYGLRPVSRLDLPKKQYYDYLNREGLKSVIINLPSTYPPKAIDGLVISGLFTQSRERAFYPPEKIKDYEEEWKEYRVVYDNLSEATAMHNILEFQETAKRRIRLAKKAFEKEEWDHYWLVFSGTDGIGHIAAGHYGLKTKEYDEIKRFYAMLDEFLGWIIENKPKDSALLLVSDHGISAKNKRFYVNRWLRSKGYLKEGFSEEKRKGEFSHEKGRNLKVGSRMSKLAGYVRKNKLAFKAAKAAKGLLEKASGKRVVLGSRRRINHAESQVFGVAGSYRYGLHLNDSRFPSPKVSEKTKKELKKELVAALKELKDEKGPLFEWVKPKEEVYEGEARYGSDVCYMPRDDVILESSLDGDEILLDVSAERKGFHSPTGMVLVHGPGIKKGGKLDWMIWDIAPAVLSLHGIKLECDGDAHPEIREK